MTASWNNTGRQKAKADPKTKTERTKIDSAYRLRGLINNFSHFLKLKRSKKKRKYEEYDETHVSSFAANVVASKSERPQINHIYLREKMKYSSYVVER